MTEADLPRRLALSPTSSLTLPHSLRQNKSFTQLARFIGFPADDQPSPGETDIVSGDEEVHDATLSNQGDDDQDGDADEESLLWDAQVSDNLLSKSLIKKTALIAHQPALAAKYYATAALPPHSSPAACLALGNLLARGSDLAQTESHLPGSPTSAKQDLANDVDSSRKPQQHSWFATIFGQQRAIPPAKPRPAEESRAPPVKGLTSNGWQLPTDGKRVVRNVEAMGKAGGWLVLGIGLVIEAESQRAPKFAARQRKDSEEEGVIVFDSRVKGHSRSRADVQSATAQSSPLSATSSATVESLAIHTPDEGHDSRTPSKRIKLLVRTQMLYGMLTIQYDLLTPLVQLYRHGHIQRHDPVALPPIPHSQLPRALNPKGDKEKGRNTWYLGSAVAGMLLDLPLLTSVNNLGREASARRHGVLIMANYIVRRVH